MTLSVLIMIVAGYLVGSLNMAIITCKLFGLPSPCEKGSGNPGATNVLRLGGKSAAAVTLAGDVLKGFLPVIIAGTCNFTPATISVVGIAAVLGHILPVFHGFQGGKGVATLIGVMFGFSWIVGIVFAGVWLVTAAIFRYSSLASLVATAVSPVTVFICFSVQPAVFFVMLALLVIFRHHENIHRLVNGMESRIGEKSRH